MKLALSAAAASATVASRIFAADDSRRSANVVSRSFCRPTASTAASRSCAALARSAFPASGFCSCGVGLSAVGSGSVSTTGCATVSGDTPAARRPTSSSAAPRMAVFELLASFVSWSSLDFATSVATRADTGGALTPASATVAGCASRPGAAGSVIWVSWPCSGTPCVRVTVGDGTPADSACWSRGDAAGATGSSGAANVFCGRLSRMICARITSEVNPKSESCCARASIKRASASLCGRIVPSASTIRRPVCDPKSWMALPCASTMIGACRVSETSGE